MPYPRELFFKPSSKFRTAWAKTPQNRVLDMFGHKTKSMYDTLSSAIPIYYVLALLAIAFDIYLGFNILAKSGVHFGLIIGSVFLDAFLAILPYLASFKPNTIKNKIFTSKMKRKTKKNNETDEEFKNRQVKEDYETKRLNGSYKKTQFLNYLFYLLIFGIAFWKIFTYMSILPPNLSIFSMVNGKIVIIFSILTAVFHIIGTEKALAHLVFWKIKNSELKKFHEDRTSEDKPEYLTLPIDYIGNYKETKFGNTELIIDENGSISLKYFHMIWDDEIKNIIQRQGDDNAKRGVAIICKENQILD